MAYLVLDFGGSAVKCAVMSQQAIALEQFSLPSQASSYDEWLDRLAPEFERCQNQYDIEGIAISSCGSVDVDTGIIHGASALPYIHGFDVKILYQQRFNVPVEIENDACCAALAESWLGSGKKSSHFCLLVIGSGIGGAIVSDQQVMKGHHLHGAEFGYTILDHQVIDNRSVPKTFSQLGATASLIEQAGNALQETNALQVDSTLNLDIDTLDGVKVFELYDQKNPLIIEVVDNWLSYLAAGIYNIQYSIDPEFIILGGAISRRHDLIKLINQKLDNIFADIPIASIRPQLKVSDFGNDANLVGALKHFMNRQNTLRT